MRGLPGRPNQKEARLGHGELGGEDGESSGDGLSKLGVEWAVGDGEAGGVGSGKAGAERG